MLVWPLRYFFYWNCSVFHCILYRGCIPFELCSQLWLWRLSIAPKSGVFVLLHAVAKLLGAYRILYILSRHTMWIVDFEINYFAYRLRGGSLGEIFDLNSICTISKLIFHVHFNLLKSFAGRFYNVLLKNIDRDSYWIVHTLRLCIRDGNRSANCGGIIRQTALLYTESSRFTKYFGVAAQWQLTNSIFDLCWDCREKSSA